MNDFELTVPDLYITGWSCDLQGMLGIHHHHPPPWTEFLTHASENNTLPQLCWGR